MRVLLTRARTQSAGTAARLAELGYETEILPLVEVRALRPAIPEKSYDGVVFTSSHAPLVLADMIGAGEAPGRFLDLPAWSVGVASAAAARQAGFTQVSAGPADAGRLASIIDNAFPAGSCILYPSGEHIAHDLQGALAQMEVVRVIFYTAALVDPGKPALLAALRTSAGGAVFLYSERTARHFVDLVDVYGLTGALGNLTLIAISEKTAEAARRLTGIPLIIAENPCEDAMLAALAQL